MSWATIEVQGEPEGPEVEFCMPSATTVKYAAARVAESLCDPDIKHGLAIRCGKEQGDLEDEGAYFRVINDDELIGEYHLCSLILVHK